MARPSPPPPRPISGISPRREAWQDIDPPVRQPVPPVVSPKAPPAVSPKVPPAVSPIKSNLHVLKRILPTLVIRNNPAPAPASASLAVNVVTSPDFSATYTTTTTTTTKYPGRIHLAMICIGLLLGNFIVALDTSIIATAIPTITTDFQSMDDVGWYGSAYLLTLTALQPSYSNIFRLFSKKWAYLISMVIFEIGSLLCAASQRSIFLVLGRAIAGIGAAGILQGSLSTITLSVPFEKRAIYISLVSSIFGISACFGPLLGGFLTEKLTWRWCFWINIPIGGTSILANILFFNPPRDSFGDEKLPIYAKLRQMDIFGASVLISAVFCLVLGLQWAGSVDTWYSPNAIGLIFGFVVLVAVFCIIQWRLGEFATIPPRVFCQRTIFGGAWYFFFMEAVLVTHTYFLPFYFQSVQGVSPAQGGLRNIPYHISTILGFVVSGAIVCKIGYYIPFIGFGAIVAAVGSGMMTTLGLSSKKAYWIGFQALAGFGVGLGLQLPFAAIPVVLNDHDVPIGNAITVFLGLLGGTIGLPITQSIFSNAFMTELPKYTSDIDPLFILSHGATNINSFKYDNGDDMEAVLKQSILSAWAIALQRALILPVAAAAMAFAFAWIMEWKSLNGKRAINMEEVMEDKILVE